MMPAGTAPQDDPDAAHTLAADDTYSIGFLASEPAVRTILGDLRGWLHGANVPADSLGTVELVLAEALNNIVEHAYAQTGRGPVQMSVRRHKAHLAFDVLDQGLPLPGLVLPVPNLPGTDGPVCTLPEGGFGWFLIHRLTYDLTYQRDTGRNHLCFNIRTNNTLSN